MRIVKRVCLGFLIVAFLAIQVPGAVYGGQEYFVAQVGTGGVTVHLPEMQAPPEQDIPMERVEKKSNTLYYVLGGLVVVGGALAAAGGGGGGNGGNGVTTGDVTVSW